MNQHLRNRFLPATVTAAVTPGTHNPRISAQTVRNRLAEDGLYGRRPYVGPVLTAVHHRNRDQWARAHINWTRQRWRINDWPSKSPDINPIEHLWDNLDKRIRRRQNPPTNVNELRTALLEEWNNIPQDDINKLVLSMRRRCQAVADARGGHTRY